MNDIFFGIVVGALGGGILVGTIGSGIAGVRWRDEHHLRLLERCAAHTEELYFENGDKAVCRRADGTMVER